MFVVVVGSCGGGGDDDDCGVDKQRLELGVYPFRPFPC